MPWIAHTAAEIRFDSLARLMRETVAQAKQRVCPKPRRVLLLPPDITRMHSGAGRLTEILYHLLAGEADVHVIPTLGQHVPHGAAENRQMFGSIPLDRIHSHDWRHGCVGLGEVAADFVERVSHGVANWPLPILLNRMLMEETWDLVINVGQVVPHEVLGFANHNKNYFIGLGGKELICASHLMAARCGIENNLGRLLTPVRECFNHAEEAYLSQLPDFYVQLVMGRNHAGELVHTGVYVGDDQETYLAAARQSRDENITVLEQPIAKIVCVMQEDEFASTWVANKAIYRTRMALADGGELVIIAPGLRRFGEQPEVDALIRKYGYRNSTAILELYHSHADLQQLAHAAAHLMHGSPEGRFAVTYAPGHLSREEIESVHYQFADLTETLARYRPDRLQQGWNQPSDGEPFYFIPSPSTGLWATRDKLYGRPGGLGP
jgi:nickel-dependent lactate racemase